ncbi:hypothetical protein LCGC14_0785950 [marine sediment metagenome]|uniref:Uncharacterized protein n=1 Tax=marine sediment metagenome TaxID=412755 RepID=A0A0F9T147_9ZZZZ
MCECLASLREQGYKLPFEQRISFTMQTEALIATPWGVELQCQTKTRRRSSAGSKFLLLNYCPICGKDLREKSEEGDDGE